MSGLVQAFLSEVAGTGTAARITPEVGELGAKLASCYVRGRAAHPHLSISEEEFARSLAQAVRAGRSLDDVAVEDLYLARACAEGSDRAIATFEQRYSPVIQRAVSRVCRTRTDQEEAEQSVRERLLVADGGTRGRVANYLGRGPLESWVAVAAMRVAISTGRSESAKRRLVDQAFANATGVDPERLLITAEIRQEMKAATADAIARLTHRERMALGFHVVGGMTVDAIGKAIGVSHQAVSKMLGRARERLRADILSTLKTRLRISEDDLSSMVRFVSSQFDVSVSGALRNR